MATCDPKPQLPPLFTPRQQALIEQIFSTKITELIASGGLVCSHCSNSSSSTKSSTNTSSSSSSSSSSINSSNNTSTNNSNNSSTNNSSSLLPRSPTDSKVCVSATPLQEHVTKFQQFIDNHLDDGANTFNPSTNYAAANPSASAHFIGKLTSVEQRVRELESRFTKSESSMVQSNNFDPRSKNVDTESWLKRMHAKFETTMSKLQSASQQITNNQQNLESTDCENNKVQCRLDSASSSKVTLEQSHVENSTVMQSVAVDRREVLSTLVLNIGTECKELAEFVRQLSQCTASAADVVELKAIVECMARVTGVSEHKAEQLITEFIRRESEELEQLKCEQRLADDKIRELQLARDQKTEMCNSSYQNHLPYLNNLVTETMRSECRRYKHDLDAMAKRLSDCVNAKVAQAIKQLLVDKHLQCNEERSESLSIDTLDMKPPLPPPLSPELPRSTGKIATDLLQPIAEDGSTLIEKAASATAALEDKTKTKLLKNAQLSSVSTPPRPRCLNFDQATYQQLTSAGYRCGQAINCVVVGHESAQAQKLVRAYVKKMSGRSITCCAEDNNNSVDEVVERRSGIVYKLHLADCTEANKLSSINYCDVIIVCFSVVDKVSYLAVRDVWLKQIKKVFPDRPFLLVGTQADKRGDIGIKNFQVNYMTGLQLSREIAAVDYFECSELDVGGNKTMFMQAMKYAIDMNLKKYVI